jgi:hypothetical protein
MGSMPMIRFHAGATYFFSLLHSVQTYYEPHSASYPMCTGALSQWVKRTGPETGHHLMPRPGMVELYLLSPYVFFT